MKKMILIATIALSTTACTTAGKKDLAKPELDEVEPLSDRSFSLDDRIAKHYARAQARVVKRRGVSKDVTLADGERECPEIETKEECMPKGALTNN